MKGSSVMLVTAEGGWGAVLSSHMFATGSEYLADVLVMAV